MKHVLKAAFFSGKLKPCAPICHTSHSPCPPTCPIVCCSPARYHEIQSLNALKHEEIPMPSLDRPKVNRESCNCLMECDGQDNGKCHEKCTCHPDNRDASKVDAKKITARRQDKKRKKKFSHPHIGSKEMNKIKRLFTKWMKEYSGDGHKAKEKGQTLKDERVNFIDKMLNNYQHFRRKENALKLLQEQQDELKDQQEHLERLLTREEEAMTKTGTTHNAVAKPSSVRAGLNHSHNDDVNITITTSNTTKAPPTTSQPPVSQQTIIDIELIKKQIAEIQIQQSFLSKQQTELAAQVSKEEALFEQARQLIMLLLKKNEEAGNLPPTAPTPTAPEAAGTQAEDYGGEFNSEVLANREPVQASGLLNQLQNVLSKLVFTEDGKTIQDSPGDGEQMMYFQGNQEDQLSNGMQNENYEKNEINNQAPGNVMYNVPVEFDRNDLNDLSQRNSLFGRNDVNGDSEEDNDNTPFNDSDDDTEQEYAVMEKKTLHATKSRANSDSKGEIPKKDTRKGQTKKHIKNHVGGKRR